MEIKLKDYQAIDVALACKMGNHLNANRPGYGKTIETIEFVKRKDLKIILVICPKSAIYQWESAFKKWWFDEPFNIEIVPAHIPLKPPTSTYIVIINYDWLVSEQYVQEFRHFRWDITIADECHRIKNPSSARGRNIFKIPSKYRVGLTGTPIMKNPKDLWNQLRWIDFTKIGAMSERKWDFLTCEMQNNGFGFKPIGLTKNEKNQQILRQMLESVTIRNPALNITPGIQRIFVPLAMSSAQKKLYARLSCREPDLDALPEGITITNGMSQLLRLQQLTSCPEMFNINDNPKIEWIIDWLKDNPSEKVIIFSKWTTVLDHLAKRLKTNFVKYTGQLTSKEQQASKKQFICNPSTRVLLGSIGALGEAVDGLQTVCSNVIFVDRDWTPALNEQAESRVDRSGQSTLVNSYILECKGSKDKYLGRVLIHREEDVRQILDAEDDE